MSQIELPELDAVKSNIGGSRRVDVAGIRREQIVEAAVQIIVEQGLHSLSLSKIEEITGMKRGQLTYYFPTKEDILLAVFDRLLQRMLAEVHGVKEGEKHALPPIWDHVQRMIQRLVTEGGPGIPFRTLEYTFLAQMPHRPDFQTKLAVEYGNWRQGMAAHWKLSANPGYDFAKGLDPKVLASFLMAVVMGLAKQMAADPEAFDRKAMQQFLLSLLGPLFTDMDPQSPGDTNHG